MSFPALLPLTKCAGKCRGEQRRAMRIQLPPDHQHDDPHFVGVPPADPLSDHVLPLVGSGTYQQNITKSLRGSIACGTEKHYSTTVTTDARGEAEFEMPPGKYTITEHFENEEDAKKYVCTFSGDILDGGKGSAELEVTCEKTNELKIKAENTEPKGSVRIKNRRMTVSSRAGSSSFPEQRRLPEKISSVLRRQTQRALRSSPMFPLEDIQYGKRIQKSA